MINVKNINNERAKFAFARLSNIKCNESNFRSLARSFPTMVHANGIVAAVAFLYAKKGKNTENKKTSEHKEMYEILSEWLLRTRCFSENKKDKESELMQAVTVMDNEELRRTTTEAMALLIWIKRFAEGMFKENDKVKQGSKDDESVQDNELKLR